MKKFRASFSSTGNLEVDAKLGELRAQEQRVEAIVAACSKYDVSAEIFGASGKLLASVERGGFFATRVR